MTKIEWTEKTWNPITGCTRHSEGCLHCYAFTMSKRLKAMGLEKYKNGFELTLHEKELELPKRWCKPHMVFVCSMSDLFHSDVPFEYIDKVMNIIRSTPQHTYQILTKRAEIMSKYFSTREVPDNVWLGVTVESESLKWRIEHLRYINTKNVRFLSCEPLLENLGRLNLDDIDWVIVGGESGPEARQMKEDWVLKIKEQCESQNVKFFFKQWGEWGSDGVKRNKKANGCLLQGKEYKEIPNMCSNE